MTGNTMEWIDQPSGKHSCNAMNYARLRKACAKWFGVDVKQLPSLPIPKPVSQVREEARRKEYFFTRKLN